MYNEQMLRWIAGECERHGSTLIDGRFSEDVDVLIEHKLIDRMGFEEGNIRMKLSAEGAAEIRRLNMTEDDLAIEAELKANEEQIKHEADLRFVAEEAERNSDIADQLNNYDQTAIYKGDGQQPNAQDATEFPDEVPAPTQALVDLMQRTPVWAQPQQPVQQQSPFGGDVPTWAMPQSGLQQHPIASLTTDNARVQYEAPAEAPYTAVNVPHQYPQPQVEVVRLLPPAQRKKRESKTASVNLYPFDTMEIGMAFYIPPSDKHPNPAKDCVGLVTSANRKYAVQKHDENGQPVSKFNSYNRTVKDEAGNVVLDSQGNKRVIPVTSEVPELVYTKRFTIYAADKVPNQPYKDGAYIFRVEPAA